MKNGSRPSPSNLEGRLFLCTYYIEGHSDQKIAHMYTVMICYNLRKTSHRFGSVEFVNAADAHKIRAAIISKEIDGRAINVELSRLEIQHPVRSARIGTATSC